MNFSLRNEEPDLLLCKDIHRLLEKEGGASGKEGLDAEAGKMPWRRWQPTSVFLPGNSIDRGVWWDTVRRVVQSQTRLKQLNMHAHRARDSAFQGLCLFASALQHVFSNTPQCNVTE